MTDNTRLHERIEKLAEFSDSEEGINAVEGSAANKRARDQLVAWMVEDGLEVSVDRIGNIIGVLQGGTPEAKPVILGSHIDTVPTGGKYDGRYGVIAALEVASTLKKELEVDQTKKLDHPVLVIAFAGEEGVRFQPAMIGSRVFLDPQSLAEALERPSILRGEETTMGKELEQMGYTQETTVLPGIGYEGTVLPLRRLGIKEPADGIEAYLEAHIEQGPVMEAKKIPVAAVESVQGISQWQLTIAPKSGKHARVVEAVSNITEFVNTRAANDETCLAHATVGMIHLETSPADTNHCFAVTFRGQPAHAGCFPMHMRKDAAHIAAILANRISKARGAVEDFQVIPGAINVIPSVATVTLRIPEEMTKEDLLKMAEELRLERGLEQAATVAEAAVTKATMTVDQRHIDDRVIDMADDALRNHIEQVGKEYGVTISKERLQRIPPAVFDGSLVNMVAKRATEQAKQEIPRVNLGAGHDACNFAYKGVKAAMVAVPSRGGISHNIAEYTEPENLELGVKVLTDVARELAMGTVRERGTPRGI